MPVNTYREVLFNKYCKECKHLGASEYTEPCFTCVGNPVALESERPIKFEKKEGK